jgi:predicted 3-demethylubiquinone-9 3-methyltransferase (glyoxalase superfamily)
MQRLTTFLWFDTQAEEAANYYTSVFDDGKITDVKHYGSAGPRPAGMVMTVEFELAGQKLIALNGGPEYKLTNPCRSWSTATPRTRWTTIGASSATAARKAPAAG